jgi:hypothetical protein
MIAGGVAGLAIMVGRHSTGWAEIVHLRDVRRPGHRMLANPSPPHRRRRRPRHRPGVRRADRRRRRQRRHQQHHPRLREHAVRSSHLAAGRHLREDPAQTIAFGHALEGCATPSPTR